MCVSGLRACVYVCTHARVCLCCPAGGVPSCSCVYSLRACVCMCTHARVCLCCPAGGVPSCSCCVRGVCVCICIAVSVSVLCVLYVSGGRGVHVCMCASAYVNYVMINMFCFKTRSPFVFTESVWNLHNDSITAVLCSMHWKCAHPVSVSLVGVAVFFMFPTTATVIVGYKCNLISQRYPSPFRLAHNTFIVMQLVSSLRWRDGQLLFLSQVVREKLTDVFYAGCLWMPGRILIKTAFCHCTFRPFMTNNVFSLYNLYLPKW